MKTSKNTKSPAAETAKAALDAENIVEKETKKEPEVNVEEIVRNLTEEGARPSKDRWDMENLGFDRPLPSFILNDHTFFPGTSVEFEKVKIWDRNIAKYRTVGLPRQFVYQWGATDPREASSDRMAGWKYCLYKGGQHSGIDVGGFSGTDMFEEMPDGRVRNGDTLLMFMEIRRAEAIDKENKKIQDAQDSHAVNMFMDDAYKRGIRGFTENEYGDKTTYN